MDEHVPVSVLTHPHWRVNFRPESYQEQLIPSLKDCFEVVESSRVSLRGWDYPHLSLRDNERGVGLNWAGSWVEFEGHIEFWRFYQSGQFIHLFSVREATECGWKEKLESETRWHLSYMKNMDWAKVPGYINIINFLYSITEIFEFMARLCQKGIYKGNVTVTIQLKGIRGFLLTVGLPRSWHGFYAAGDNILGRSWTLQSDLLVSDSANQSLDAAVWFYERFGWLDPSRDILKRDQAEFISKQR